MTFMAPSPKKGIRLCFCYIIVSHIRTQKLFLSEKGTIQVFYANISQTVVLKLWVETPLG